MDIRERAMVPSDGARGDRRLVHGTVAHENRCIDTEETAQATLQNGQMTGFGTVPPQRANQHEWRQRAATVSCLLGHVLLRSGPLPGLYGFSNDSLQEKKGADSIDGGADNVAARATKCREVCSTVPS